MFNKGQEGGDRLKMDHCDPCSLDGIQRHVDFAGRDGTISAMNGGERWTWEGETGGLSAPGVLLQCMHKEMTA